MKNMVLRCPTFVSSRCLQFVAGVSAAMTFLIVGTIAAWPSQAFPKLEESLESKVTPGEWVWIILLRSIGGILTSIPAGFFANILGRKPVLLASAPFFLVSWLIIIYARSSTELLISRAVAGFGIGIVFSLCPVYLAEIAEDKIRGILGTLMQILMNVGILLELAVGPYLSYSTLGWLSGFFPLLFLVLMAFMPESPRYHCMKKKRDRAERSLMILRGAKDAREIQEELDQMQKVVEEEMTNKGTPCALVATRGTRRALLLLYGLINMQQFCGYVAITSSTQDVFKISVGNALDPSVFAIILVVINLTASVVTSVLVDRIGRRILLMVSTAGCAVSLFVFGTFQYLTLKVGSDTSSWNWLPLACMVTFLITYFLGIGPLPIAYCGEIFPTNVRALALSVASMTLPIALVINTILFRVVVDAAGVYVTCWCFALVNLAGTIFVYFFVLETKGKSLEHIVAELNQEKPSRASPTVFTTKL